MGITIQHEQPELEKAKVEMLRKEEDFKLQLVKSEKDLLETLATAEGNLLENTSLIETLTLTKIKSAEIAEALVRSAEASVKLDEQRQVYSPFANNGAKLYFLVKALQNVSHMYQFSLAHFIILFKESLAVDSEVTKIEDRLSFLISNLEVRTLYFIGRALFKADRPMFALHLVKVIIITIVIKCYYLLLSLSLSLLSLLLLLPGDARQSVPTKRMGSFHRRISCICLQ